MELPLDAQGSGRRLDVDERVEQCRAVTDVLHVLAWFILLLQMQHLRGIHTYKEEASRIELQGLRRWLREGERRATARFLVATIRVSQTTPPALII
jgi:hypothetical protein